MPGYTARPRFVQLPFHHHLPPLPFLQHAPFYCSGWRPLTCFPPTFPAHTTRYAHAFATLLHAFRLIATRATSSPQRAPHTHALHHYHALPSLLYLRCRLAPFTRYYRALPVVPRSHATPDSRVRVWFSLYLLLILLPIPDTPHFDIFPWTCRCTHTQFMTPLCHTLPVLVYTHPFYVLHTHCCSTTYHLPPPCAGCPHCLHWFQPHTCQDTLVLFALHFLLSFCLCSLVIPHRFTVIPHLGSARVGLYAFPRHTTHCLPGTFLLLCRIYT